MKLNLQWTAGLSGKEKQTLEELLRNKPIVLKRLKEIVQQRIAEIDTLETKISDYNQPSWAPRQAHRNGHKAGLKEIADLLSYI